jgi:hypothetical protein
MIRLSSFGRADPPHAIDISDEVGLHGVPAINMMTVI